jgi:hypothetical protein
MVAMSGAIMPDPLMIADSVTVVSPTMAVAVAPLAKVSVVPMVCAASSQVQGSASKAASIPARALSLGSGTPITPVEETNTCSRAQPRCAETCSMIASTASRPR